MRIIYLVLANTDDCATFVNSTRKLHINLTLPPIGYDVTIAQDQRKGKEIAKTRFNFVFKRLVSGRA